MRKPVPFFAAPFFVALALLPLAGCAAQGQTPAAAPAARQTTLPEARRGFVTHLLVQKRESDPLPTPPAGFALVRYRAPGGDFPAFVTVPPPGGGRRPALIWLTGGFSNSLGDTAWAPATPDNDQSARAFPRAGILTMYPSLRGGNPGFNECLYGEVDDVLAAARYLASRPDVDPARIYLGGHSTGGTLALLCAESSRGFRAVFSFGPVEAVGAYGADSLPFDFHDKKELLLRAPVLYLNTIATPTFVFEGTEEPGNIDSLRKMRALCVNPRVRFYEARGFNHFSELAPVTPLVAAGIVHDTGAAFQFALPATGPQAGPKAR